MAYVERAAISYAFMALSAGTNPWLFGFVDQNIDLATILSIIAGAVYLEHLQTCYIDVFAGILHFIAGILFCCLCMHILLFTFWLPITYFVDKLRIYIEGTTLAKKIFQGSSWFYICLVFGIWYFVKFLFTIYAMYATKPRRPMSCIVLNTKMKLSSSMMSITLVWLMKYDPNVAWLTVNIQNTSIV